MLLKPATGSTIYESTEYAGGYSGAFAFDGTINAAGTGVTNTGPSNEFAANGDAVPLPGHNPILAFNPSSTATIRGFGYAQFDGPADTLDLVQTINVFSLSQARYNIYIGGLVISGNPRTPGRSSSN